MFKKLSKWLFNKPKKGIIKMDQTRIHYYKSLISFDKRDNIVEQIIKDKMEYGNRRRQKDSQVTKKDES